MSRFPLRRWRVWLTVLGTAALVGTVATPASARSSVARTSGGTAAVLTSAPTPLMGSDAYPVYSGGQNIEVFWAGEDGNLWEAAKNPEGGFETDWFAARDLGIGPISSAPYPVSPGDGTIDVFWQGSDGNLQLARYRPGSGWAGPAPLTTLANMASDPSPVYS